MAADGCSQAYGLPLHSTSHCDLISLEMRVPEHHPLRLIRRIVNEVLADLDRELRSSTRQRGPSIAPERLLRAFLLQRSTQSARNAS